MALLKSVETLKEELGLHGNILEVINSACEQLGVNDTGFLPTRAEKCLEVLFGPATTKRPLDGGADDCSESSDKRLRTAMIDGADDEQATAVEASSTLSGDDTPAPPPSEPWRILESDDTRFTSCVVVHGMGGTGKVSGSLLTADSC